MSDELFSDINKAILYNSDKSIAIQLDNIKLNDISFENETHYAKSSAGTKLASFRDAHFIFTITAYNLQVIRKDSVGLPETSDASVAQNENSIGYFLE